MNRSFSTIFFLLISYPLFGQSASFQQVQLLVDNNQYTEANTLLDSILETDSNSVDAWMWKGNVQYYAWEGYSAAVTPVNIFDENIYHTDAAFDRSEYAYVPKPVADSCAKYFLHALSIDSTRSDILAGLCFIYSISGNADALIKTLPYLQRISAMDAFSYKEYAYHLYDIGEQKKGLSVFEKICSLFPENGNLLSDLAVYYFDMGDVLRCEQTIDRSIDKKGLDDISYANAFFLYGIMERYADALLAIKKQSAAQTDDLYRIYSALLNRFVPDLHIGEPMCGSTLEQRTDDAAFDYAEILCGPLYADNMQGYSLLLDVPASEAYAILIHHYFATKFPEAFTPSYKYAESLTYCGRYTDAVSQFAQTDTSLASAEEMYAFHFYYAWALYQTQNTDANAHWSQLLDCDIPYYVTAACYFLGKHAVLSNDHENALKYFSSGSTYVEKTKYGSMCAQWLKDLQ